MWGERNEPIHGGGERAKGYAPRHSPPKWEGGWLYNPLLATASQISSLQRRRPFFADAEICRWSALGAELGPAFRLGHLCGYPVRSKKALLEEQISVQRCYKCCAFIVRRAGIPCTLMTITPSMFHAWGNPKLMLRSAGLIARTYERFSLSSLRSQLASFREQLRPSRPSIFFLPGICFLLFYRSVSFRSHSFFHEFIE